MAGAVIKTVGLERSFDLGPTTVKSLRGVDLEIEQGEFVVIFGPSGCGKTTLLSLLAGLDRPSAGEVLVRDIDIYKLNEKELAWYRRNKIGMVFQQFNLVPSLSARDNIALPLILSGIGRREAYKRAGELAGSVGIEARLGHRPPQLSGGEQQRVAIARALAANPWILLVDEPTGNLDLPSGSEIMSILKKVNGWGRTVILVTHNPDYLQYGDRVLHMADGKIVKEEKGKKTGAEKSGVAYYIASKKGRMKFWEEMRFSFIHFFSKKLRTFLTTLGVALGVGSIVTLVSLGVGLGQITAKQIASFDTLVTINVSTNKNSANTLDGKTVERIAALPNIVLVSPTLNVSSKAVFGNSTTDVILQGVEEKALDFEGIKLIEGGKWQDGNGIILSKAAAKNFDIKDYKSAVGKKVKLEFWSSPGAGELNLEKLAGSKKVAEEAVVAGVSSDELVSAAYVPLPRLAALSGRSEYSAIKAKVSDRKKVGAARDEIEKLGFTTTSVVDLIDQVDRVFSIVQIVLGIIGGIALIVALIGIINVMTISLLERTHEVGIMKAVGATNHDIKRIFQYEVILFGLFGGLFGVLGAWALGAAINKTVGYLLIESKFDASMQVFVTPVFFAAEMVVFSVIVSLIAGWYPSRHAAKLSPMESLRYE